VKDMKIKYNDYIKEEMVKRINEKNYTVNRTYEHSTEERHHLHHACEILIVESGDVEYYITGKKYLVGENDIVVIGSMENHSFRILSPPYKRYGFTIKPSYCKSLNLERDLLQVFTTPTPTEFIENYKNIDTDELHEIVELLKQLKSEEVSNLPYCTLNERMLITMLSIKLFRIFKLKRSTSIISSMDGRMQELKEYVDSHYYEKIDLVHLSKIFYLHPSTISKEFKRCFATTLVKYINTVRVCEATQLLESSQHSISYIAEKSGYENVNSFIRQFKAIMGVPPLQYRKSIHAYFQAEDTKL
jgi:YesN/AraC family two-component response regulator